MLRYRLHCRCQDWQMLTAVSEQTLLVRWAYAPPKWPLQEPWIWEELCKLSTLSCGDSLGYSEARCSQSWVLVYEWMTCSSRTDWRCWSERNLLSYINGHGSERLGLNRPSQRYRLFHWDEQSLNAFIPLLRHLRRHRFPFLPLASFLPRPLGACCRSAFKALSSFPESGTGGIEHVHDHLSPHKIWYNIKHLPVFRTAS